MSQLQEKVRSLTKEDECTYEDWSIETVKSSIMGSQCEAENTCSTNLDCEQMCKFCCYEKCLNLPSLPDMLFANNSMKIKHKSGGCIEFHALEALKNIGDSPGTIQVAHAQEWQEARADIEFAKKVIREYDWTYSTSYTGTIKGNFLIVPTDERIDIDKLKIREQILFYQEIFLYEDELDDNGCTRCIVKVRVMPSGFLVVLRHYLRVDHIIIRIHDTRLYFAQGHDYILRNISKREAPFSQIQAEPAVYRNPDLIWEQLPLLSEKTEKIIPTIS